MAAVSAHDVAAAIRRRLPGVPLKKLHKLLYFAQGFHLAHTGEPLFVEPIEAWRMGPVVGDLWRAEEHDDPPEAIYPLDNGQANTVGYVLSRYGNNSGTDLENITHQQRPWASAWRRRLTGAKHLVIDTGSVRTCFLEILAADRAEDEVQFSDEDIARFTAGALQRAALPSKPDTVESLLARLPRG